MTMGGVVDLFVKSVMVEHEVQVKKAIEDAVVVEREACARLAETLRDEDGHADAFKIAAAIRARS